MPWRVGTHGSASRYREPGCVQATDQDVDDLLERRKEVIGYRDAMLGHQKLCGRDLPDMARFFKDRAGEAMKEYRGLCYVISRLVADPPGDCRDIVLSRELSDEADYCFGLVEADLRSLAA